MLRIVALAGAAGAFMAPVAPARSATQLAAAEAGAE